MDLVLKDAKNNFNKHDLSNHIIYLDEIVKFIINNLNDDISISKQGYTYRTFILIKNHLSIGAINFLHKCYNAWSNNYCDYNNIFCSYYYKISTDVREQVLKHDKLKYMTHIHVKYLYERNPGFFDRFFCSLSEFEYYGQNPVKSYGEAFGIEFTISDSVIELNI